MSVLFLLSVFVLVWIGLPVLANFKRGRAIAGINFILIALAVTAIVCFVLATLLAGRKLEQHTMRKMHLIRPDLIQYPVAVEVYA